MAATAIQWPAALMPRQVHFSPATQSRTGGQSLNGSEQVVVSDAGRWMAKVVVSVRGESSNLALRAFLAQMNGRAGTVLVPKWDLYRPSDIQGRPMSQVQGVGYGQDDMTQGAGFNFDLSGMGQDDMPAAQLWAAALSGSTEVTMATDGNEGPRPGHYFGIGQRLYLTSQAWQETVEGPIKTRFWPRLRASASAGVPVILDKPVCLMRFASDDEGTDMMGKRGSGTLTFNMVEAI